MSPEERRAYDREWYARQTEKRKAHKVALQRDRCNYLVEYLREYRSSRGCIRCSENHPAALDLHHVTSDKVINPADMARRGWSIARMQSELEKCVVLCANCHRKEHYLAGRSNG